MKYFVSIIILVVLGITIVGFFSVGTPMAERERRFDSTRVKHLQIVQSELLRYWQSKGTLPQDLSQLRDDVSGFAVPVDPESGKRYEYSKSTDNDFELCALFNRSSEEKSYGSMMREPYPAVPMMGKPYPVFGMLDNWSHGIGHACFSRTIDKDLYKPFQVSPPPLR
ncbi:MAG: hypothetical protein Q7S47_02700 [bacterium]|nr:hypothetical protein [bacterium]